PASDRATPRLRPCTHRIAAAGLRPAPGAAGGYARHQSLPRGRIPGGRLPGGAPGARAAGHLPAGPAGGHAAQPAPGAAAAAGWSRPVAVGGFRAAGRLADPRRADRLRGLARAGASAQLALRRYGTLEEV